MYISMQRADLNDLYTRLVSEQEQKLDFVAASDAIRFDNVATVNGQHTKTRPFMHLWSPSDNGYTGVRDAGFQGGVMARKAEQNLSAKLNIPIRYYDYLANSYPNLLNTNLNYLLSRDAKRYLVRAFKPASAFIDAENAPDGFAHVRSVLSDKYKHIDNLEVLHGVLNAIKRSGVDIECRSASVTENYMYLDFVAKDPHNFPGLLEGYRDPRTGDRGDVGIVSGFSIRNSETGSSRFQIVPRAVVLACNNGMTIRRDVIARTHLGSRITDSGIVWSDATMRKEMELIRMQTQDAIQQFLSPEYLGQAVETLMKYRAPLEHPMAAVRNVANELRIDQEELDSLMEYFYKSEDNTTTGIYHAVTHLAGNLPVERQYELEEQAFELVPRIGKMDYVPSKN